MPASITPFFVSDARHIADVSQHLPARLFVKASSMSFKIERAS